MLSIKITSDTTKDVSWYAVYEEVRIEDFKRGFNFEITHVRKIDSHNYAWIVATSLEQATNIRKNKITFGHEVKNVCMGKSSGDDLAKKNTLILITKNLNKLKSKAVLEAEIRACMGEKNILNILFKNDAQGKLTGVCNIQCLSAAVYTKFIKKVLKYVINMLSSLPISRVWMEYPNPQMRNSHDLASMMLPRHWRIRWKQWKTPHSTHLGKKTSTKWSKRPSRKAPP